MTNKPRKDYRGYEEIITQGKTLQNMKTLITAQRQEIQDMRHISEND
jgi:hypothetical protein